MDPVLEEELKVQLKASYKNLVQDRIRYNLQCQGTIIELPSVSATESIPKSKHTISNLKATPLPPSIRKGPQQLSFQSAGGLPSLKSSMSITPQMNVPIVKTNYKMPILLTNELFQLHPVNFMEDRNVACMIGIISRQIPVDRRPNFRQVVRDVFGLMHSREDPVTFLMTLVRQENDAYFIAKQLSNMSISADYLLVMLGHYLFGVTFSGL